MKKKVKLVLNDFLDSEDEQIISNIEGNDINLKNPKDYNRDELNDIKFIVKIIYIIKYGTI